MTYKEAVTKAMTGLSLRIGSVFLGYNVKHGLAGGTLSGVNQDQLIEMPVAENLMLGAAIGLGMNGYNPVVYFERFDFILNAMDALVNHLDKIEDLSEGQFDPQVIIRVVQGSSSLFTGPTHNQDFTEALRLMVKMPVITIGDRNPLQVYGEAAWFKRVIVIENRKNYDKVI